ncbi:hypothetical protein F2P56_001629 [Juglans regia]|uniref:Reverse transcriptase zinc-binding domain-containing protein n=1 Tax=Juglans regia TaxID=51240 RepID=A0A833Y0A4_JUGRE|nr:hypothetical protein F2P56_001629 [Juglans regia]
MFWNNKKGIFSVRSFYQKITNPGKPMYPWKSIWQTKAPTKAAFFVWTASLDKILTTDNLRKRRVIVLDWCYMCKKYGESVDHLLLHCEMAKGMWDDIFSRVGLSWVMPCRLVDFLTSWRGLCGNSQIAAIWSTFSPLRWRTRVWVKSVLDNTFSPLSSSYRPHGISKVPSWLTTFAPADALTMKEEAWNAFPECNSGYQSKICCSR